MSTTKNGLARRAGTDVTVTTQVLPQPQDARRGDEWPEVWLEMVTEDPVTYGQPETRQWVLARIPGLYQPDPPRDGTRLDVAL